MDDVAVPCSDGELTAVAPLFWVAVVDDEVWGLDGVLDRNLVVELDNGIGGVICEFAPKGAESLLMCVEFCSSEVSAGVGRCESIVPLVMTRGVDSSCLCLLAGGSDSCSSICESVRLFLAIL